MKDEKLKKIKKHLGFIILILFGFLPLVDLFHPGLPITHDGQDHVARIANFYKSISSGNLIPRWAENLNWGYGHPILMFLYPLPSYLASFFHFLGFSFIDSLKIVFGVSFIASGITMYLWIREFLGEEAGIISGIFYMGAPYRFVDLYVRGAIGEHVAFVFAPLVLFFILKVLQTKLNSSVRYTSIPDKILMKKGFWFVIFGALSFAGLLLSHNAISIMFIPFILFYCLLLSLQNRKYARQLLYQYTSMLVIGFFLSAFFIIPAFLEGKYTLRDIVTKKEYANSFVAITDFLFGKWNYGGSLLLTKQIGIAHLIGIILFIVSFLYKFKKINSSIKIFSFSIVLYLISALFIMTQYSKFIWEGVTLLQKFQFPWRFLSIVVFATSVIAGLSIYFIGMKQIRNIIIILLLGAAFLFYNSFWHAQGYFSKHDSFFNDIYDGTTDTGESTPIWSVRFMEKRPRDTIEAIDGNAQIEKISRSSTVHVYRIDSRVKTRIKDNTLYFPGWNVYIDKEKINLNDIEYQDPTQRGLITFLVPKGIHEVIVKFEETNVRLFSNILSLVTLVSIAFISMFMLKKYGKKI